MAQVDSIQTNISLNLLAGKAVERCFFQETHCEKGFRCFQKLTVRWLLHKTCIA